MLNPVTTGTGDPLGESAQAEGLPGPNRSANLVSVGEYRSGGIRMAKCVDCGERIAVWEDYCPKCGGRKAVSRPTTAASRRHKKRSAILGWLFKSS